MKFGKVHYGDKQKFDSEIAIAIANAGALIFKGLLEAGSPEDFLKWTKNNAGNIVIGLSSTAGGYAGAMVSISLWSGSLTSWGSFLYWAGWMAPPVWLPVLGAVVGATAIAAIGRGTQFLLSTSKFEMAKLSYSVLSLMKNADGKVTEEEEKYMANFLAMLELPAEKKDELLKAKIGDVKDLKIPSDMSEEDAIKILKGAWGLALVDGLAQSEVVMFEQIALKFGITTDRQKKIKEEATKELEFLQEKIVSVTNLVNVLSPKIRDELADKLLDLTSKIDPVKDAKERLKRNVNKGIQLSAIVASLSSGDPAIAAQIMSSGYAVAKIVLGDDSPELEVVNQNFNLICKQLPEGERLKKLKNSTNEVIDDVEVKLKEELKKKA